MQLPDEHVIAPGGLRHRSTTHHIGASEAVQPRSEGGLRKISAAGAEDLEDLGATRGATPQTPKGPGWVAFASWAASEGPIQSYRGSFEVPPAPEAESGQTLFLFLGLQKSADDGSELFQPVLQWGQSAAGGGEFWGVSCWYLNGGQLVFSALTAVEPGDRIDVRTERIEEQGVALWESCAEVAASGKASRLRVMGELELGWSCTALEAYADAMQCRDYPASPAVRFSGLALESASGPLTPAWEPAVEDASCGARVEIRDASQVEIFYRGAAAS